MPILLLMSRLLARLEHQQSWYRKCRIYGFWSSMMKMSSITMHHLKSFKGPIARFVDTYVIWKAQGTEYRAHGSAQSYDKSVHCHLRAWPGTCLLPAWLPWYGRPRPTAYISTCQQTVSNIQKRSTQIDSFNGNLKANWQFFVYFKNPNYMFNTLLFYGRYFFMYHLFLTLIMFCTEVALTAPYPAFIFIAYSVRYKFCESDNYHITVGISDNWPNLTTTISQRHMMT